MCFGGGFSGGGEIQLNGDVESHFRTSSPAAGGLGVKYPREIPLFLAILEAPAAKSLLVQAGFAL